MHVHPGGDPMPRPLRGATPLREALRSREVHLAGLFCLSAMVFAAYAGWSTALLSAQFDAAAHGPVQLESYGFGQ